MTSIKTQNSLVFIGVVLLTLMVADRFGLDTDSRHDARKVEIRFRAVTSSEGRPVRFDIDGGFNGDRSFAEQDRRDGYRKAGVTSTGGTAWAKMYMRMDSAEPRRMECSVWQEGKEITNARAVFPELPVAFCAGTAK